MDNETLWNKVYYRLDPAMRPKPHELESWLDDMLSRACGRLLYTSLYRHLQNTYSLTFSGGVYPFGGNPEILIESIQLHGKITHPSAALSDGTLLPFIVLPTRMDLTYPPSSPFPFAALEGTNIAVSFPDASLDTAQPLSLNCCRVLTAAQLPAEIVDNVIDVLIECANERARVTPPEAEEEQVGQG